MPIGRDRTTGVNSSVLLPYPRGAFSNGLGGVGAGASWAGVSLGGSLSSSLLHDVLNVRHWHKRQAIGLALRLSEDPLNATSSIVTYDAPRISWVGEAVR